MSKKFGINTKSAEARARQDSIKQEKDKEKRQKLEDEFWKDDDKHIVKKQQRKDEKEKKENEKVQRKQENLKLLEEEETSLTTRKSSKHLDRIPIKVTQAQIQQRQIDLSPTNSSRTDQQNPQKNFNENRIELEENLNHLQLDGHSARNVDEAIRILKSSTSDLPVDFHPEKRIKSSFQMFEEKHLSRLKDENPTLRLSQLKQLLKKEWMKSTDNPFNQPNSQRNNDE